MRSTPALLTCVVLLNCKTLPSEPAQRTESLDAPFALAIGEEASIPDSLSLTFRDVVRDSRCPVDVQCIRAGEAVLVFDIVVPGVESGSVQIDVPPDGDASSTVAGFTILVEALAPETRSNATIDKDDYRATLRVTAAPRSGSVDARLGGRVS